MCLQLDRNYFCLGNNTQLTSILRSCLSMNEFTLRDGLAETSKDN